MLKSMTGFGSVLLDNEEFSLSIEIKTLNSKYSDVALRLPKYFSAEQEIELRNQATQQLERGKISISVDFQDKGIQNPSAQVNEVLFHNYYQSLQKLAKEVNAPPSDLFRLALQMPDVLVQSLQTNNLDTNQWDMVFNHFQEAIRKCQVFRKQEGEKLKLNFFEYIQKIESLLKKVSEKDPERIGIIRERLQTRIREMENSEKYDPNRFEQEILYYLEKLDITEEKVRLQNHLDYFRETLNQQNVSGKKLNFIAQEIGREINTIGSKAQDASIQRQVVEMKEELEKIKEQVLNVM